MPTLHVNHLTRHFIIRRIVGIVEWLICLQDFWCGNNEASANGSLQMMFL